MEMAQKPLENHVLYGLDRAICDYLEPILEREIGKPFRNYRLLTNKQAIECADATRTLVETMVGQPVELQEELLGQARGGTEVNLAWHDLWEAAGPEWKEFCLLYQFVAVERRDLEYMAVACQAAEDSGDPAYRERVREIMDLGIGQSPSWWAME